MRVLLTRDLYHPTDGDCDVLRMIGHKAESANLSERELEGSEYDRCETCFSDSDE